MTPDEAEEELARHLFDKMEHLDPSIDEVTWETAPLREKEFCRSCVNHLTLYRSLWELVLFSPVERQRLVHKT